MPDENTLEALPIPLRQTALATAALAVSFAEALRDIAPHQDAVATIQTKLAVGMSLLRQTPNSEDAIRMFRFVRAALHDPGIIDQPDD